MIYRTIVSFNGCELRFDSGNKNEAISFAEKARKLNANDDYEIEVVLHFIEESEEQ